MLDDNKNDTTLTDTKSTKIDAKRSKREDVILEKLIEKVIFARNDAFILDKPISVDILNDILFYLTMRCSEHYGDIVSWVQ